MEQSDAIARLVKAAEEGKVEDLYDIIKHDEDVLERIDRKAFFNTPLHIAASLGHMDFAMEIVNLNPSFTRKLNPDGFSPMHLALLKDHDLMVLWLLDIDESLARVKGRAGMTPLHYAAQQGKEPILSEFYKACPESIKDVTFSGDTALHIAVTNKQTGAFKVLIRWLGSNVFTDAAIWEREILNWKNKMGKTVLHIAASTNQREVVQRLIKEVVHTDIKDSDGLTAMAILIRQKEFDVKELRKMQRTRPHRYIISDGREVLNKELSWYSRWKTGSVRRRRTIPSERRNALLVVDALIATITYQAALSPPGGVWQGTADINSPLSNLLRLDNSSHASPSPSQYVGSSVMNGPTFSLFWFANTTVFLLTILRMIGLGLASESPLYMMSRSVLLLFSSYSFSMAVISPSKTWSNFNLVLYFCVASPFFLFFLLGKFAVIFGYVRANSCRKRDRRSMHKRKEYW